MLIQKKQCKYTHFLPYTLSFFALNIHEPKVRIEFLFQEFYSASLKKREMLLVQHFSLSIIMLSCRIISGLHGDFSENSNAL